MNRNRKSAKWKKAGMFTLTTAAVAGMSAGMMAAPAMAAEEYAVYDEAALYAEMENAQQAVDQAQQKYDEVSESAAQAQTEWEDAKADAAQAQDDYDAAVKAAQDAFDAAQAQAVQKDEEAAAQAAQAEQAYQEAGAAAEAAQSEVDSCADASAAADAQLQQARETAGVTQEEIQQKTETLAGYQSAEETKKQEAEQAQQQTDEAGKQVTEKENEAQSAQDRVDDAETQYQDAQQRAEAAQAVSDRYDTDIKSVEGMRDGTISITDTQAYQDMQKAGVTVDSKQAAADEAAAAQQQAQADLDQASAETLGAETRVAGAENDEADKRNASVKADEEAEAANTKAAGAKTEYENKQLAASQTAGALQAAETEETQAREALEAARKAREDADKEAQEAASQMETARTDAENRYQADLSGARQTVIEKQSVADKAAQDLANASERYQQGYYGFVNWMLMKENLSDDQRKDLEDARNYMDQVMAQDLSVYDYYNTGNPGLFGERGTQVLATGNERDSISLHNVGSSIAIMKDINNCRAADENFAYSSPQPAATNFYMMAVAQAGAMKGAYLTNHSTVPNDVWSENLAFGYGPATMMSGWYDQEKKAFDKARDELGYTAITSDDQIDAIADRAGFHNVGHYTNLLSFPSQVMGVGYTQYGAYRTTCCYNSTPMEWNRRASYSIDDFESIYNEYTASLNTDALQVSLDEANADLLSARGTVTDMESGKDAYIETAVRDAQTNLDAKNQAASQAYEQAAAAENALNEKTSATAQLRSDKEVLDGEVQSTKIAWQSADAEAADAQAAAQSARADLEAALAVLEQAKSDLETAQAAEADAKTALDEKTREKEDADAELANAKAIYDEAEERLARLTSDDTLAALQAGKEEADQELLARNEEKDGKVLELQEAQEALAAAQAGVDQAKSDLEAAQSAQEEAEQAYENAKGDTETTRAELEEMQARYAPVQTAADEADAAKARLTEAQDHLSEARKALEEAEDLLAECQEQKNVTAEKLAELVQILDEAGLDGDIEHEDYQYLNTFTGSVRNTRSIKMAMDEAVENARTKVAELEKEQGLAYTDYVAAEADLVLAQAEVKKAEDASAAKKAAEEEAKKTAAKTAESNVPGKTAETPSGETFGQPTVIQTVKVKPDTRQQAVIQTDDVKPDAVQTTVIRTANVEPDAVQTAVQPMNMRYTAAVSDTYIPTYSEETAAGVYGPVSFTGYRNSRFSAVSQAGTESGAIVLNRILLRGASGEDVRQVQERLSDLGYLAGEADGNYGDMTYYAVLAFQEANNLEMDGITGPETLKALNGNPVSMDGKIELARDLGAGMTGLDVFRVQKKLFDLKYFEDVPNGVFGEVTGEAIRAFQTDQGMTEPDGIMDSETLELLNEAQPTGTLA